MYCSSTLTKRMATQSYPEGWDNPGNMKMLPMKRVPKCFVLKVWVLEKGSYILK